MSPKRRNGKKKNVATRLVKQSFPPPPSPPSSRSIRRIIFNTLVKPNINEKGEKQMETISTSQALQIAGRAGRSDTCRPNTGILVAGCYTRLYSHTYWGLAVPQVLL